MKVTKQVLLATALLAFSTGISFGQNYHMQPVAIQSRWAKEVSPSNALKEYPRPQLTRNNWVNLNGLWDYAITVKDAPQPEKFDGEILVPYPLESALSGVKKSLMPNQNLWYKRTINFSPKKGHRTLLHFGAVDWQTTVYLNGNEVGGHTGGYAEFTIDLTANLRQGENTIVVKVYDPTGSGIGPHGKQVLKPENIYYTPTSGIWQTVWMESVPEAFVSGLKITPDIDKSVVNVVVRSASKSPVTLVVEGKTINGTTNSNIALPVKNAKLWSPANPYLYDLNVKMGKDEVSSYFGMRKISVAKDDKGVDRIMLNNKPYYNLGTLDQGFWPEGLYTAPTDEALAFDIKAIKAMGFNTIRKHIKVEPARWYYHADKLGMLVWQDLVNPNQGLPEGSKPQFEKESLEELNQLHNYPSIVTWVLFNEKWGQYDQKRLTNWVKQTDPSRILNGHSGELLYVNNVLRSPSPDAYIDADMTDVHAYPDPMMSVKQKGKAQVCGEFGGIGVFVPEHQWLTGSAWGYIQEKPAALQAKYQVMNQHLQLFHQQGLSGSIYTQPFDVEGEQNGLMTYDRAVVKIPFAELRKIHSALNPEMGAISEVSAQNADLTEPAALYSVLLEEYINGKREPEFLKRMAMMAIQAGDKDGAAWASDAYIATMKAPYTEQQLAYILQVTEGIKDKGFGIIQSEANAINHFMGPRNAEIKMMNIIYKDLIAPVVTGPNANPDWDLLSASINVYGMSGKEILSRAKAFHYLNHQDYSAFIAAADEYIAGFSATISPEELNQWAWTMFEKVDDKALLNRVVVWSELSDKEGKNPMFMDTRANLLYKLGKKDEAIAIQEKAVELSGNAELKATLEQMKKNK
ncbi:glycoside hydrolase family 2 protein [Pedobacter sp. PWIIR3]